MVKTRTHDFYANLCHKFWHRGLCVRKPMSPRFTKLSKYRKNIGTGSRHLQKVILR